MNTQILRKSKKFIAVFMAALMMFAFTANAFAFTDTDKLDTNVKDAIGKLTALEVVGGYADGTFRPADGITRAEFAKIASVLAGMKDGGDILQNTTSKFKDVKTGQWYTGWINVATSKGLLAGYPDGTFKPNQMINQQEVATVLMRIAGYNDNLPGPWPLDYINQATKSDVFEGMKFVGSANANRGDVAVMASNSLDLDMVKWSKDTESFENKGNDLLNENFKGAVVEDAKIKTISMKNADKNQLSLTVEYGTDKKTETFVIDATSTFSTGFDVMDSKNNITDVIFTADTKGVKTAKFVEISSKVVDAEKVSKTTDKVKLDDKSYPMAKDADANIKDTGANVVYKAYINEDGEVYAVIPDADFEGKTGVVKEVRTNKDINFFNGKIALKDKDVVILKDGKPAKFEDIQKYDVLQYNDNGDIISIESLKSGKLDRAYGTISQAVSIDGVKYPAVTKVVDNEDKDVNSWSDYIGQTVKYAVTPQGNISTVVVGDIKDGSNTMYGIVTSYSLVGGPYPDELDTVTIFNQEGKTVKYNLKDNKVFAGKAADVKPGTFVKFRLNADGAIEKSYPTEAKNNITATAKVKDGRISLGLAADSVLKYSVNDKIVAFNVDTDSKDATKLKVSLVSAKDILAGDEVSTTMFGNLPAGIQYVLDGSTLKAMVLGKFNASSDNNYGFVEDFGYDNGEFEKTVKFYGDTKEYELDSASASMAKKDQMFKYTLSGDTVTLVAAGAATFNGTVDSNDGSLFNVKVGEDKKQFMLADDTFVTKIEVKGTADSGVVNKVISDYKITNDDIVYVQMNTTNADKNTEALFAIVVEFVK